MKYDCDKILDYQHERARMCKTMSDCKSCPLFLVSSDLECYLVVEVAQKHIDVVQKWSDEHPEITKYDKFLEIIKGTEFENEFRFENRHDPLHEYSEALVSKHNHVWWNK